MDFETVPATADPGAADDALAGQPIGYWSGALHQAVVNHLRDAMAGPDDDYVAALKVMRRMLHNIEAA